MEKLVLIDGHSILNRAFYGVPGLTNSEGLHTNAVYGFLNILFKLLEEEKPGYLAVAFDLKAPTFRHLAYEGYKAQRKGMPEELVAQMPILKDVLDAMIQDTGAAITSLRADGGASANNYLMQTQSDILNLTVKRPKCVETTAMGAAYLAGLAVGYWKDKEEVVKNWEIDKTFTPDIPDEKREEMISGWDRAVKCSYGWAR